MDWKEVIGQQEMQQRLMQLVQEERVPHALLFCGPAGAGKMALALAFASQLLSGEKASVAEDDGFMMAAEDPRVTKNKAMLREWTHPDLHFTFPTIKLPSMGSDHQPVSNDFVKQWIALLKEGPYFSIEQWMTTMGAANQQAIITGAESDELSRKLALKSSQGGYKVSIIWLPERMNLTSANKLLKLLEEPPQQTVFILVSEHPEQLLETILSRTQRIDIKRIDEASIEKALIDKRGIEPDAAHRIARIANGSWLQALDALNTGNENRDFLDMFIMLMRLAYGRKVKDLKKWSENIAGYGREKQRRMLSYFMHLVRENFMYNFRQPELNYMTQEEEDFAKNFARFIHEGNIIEINELMALAYRDIGQNANAKVVFYDLALKMIVLILKK
ncbi:MAG: DNA polymerase III subunit delta [Prevotella sp.]|jgi:DNA polymerase-3 subunit delta'|nr:DNA polymerase III subunit delta [Prevotella sp.]MBR7048917.1 DNA polymerase III subunit delta [Prevotella sp.]